MPRPAQWGGQRFWYHGRTFFIRQFFPWGRSSMPRTPEQEAVLRSVRKLVDFWQISPDELVDEGMSATAVLPEAQASPAAPALPKYRHPVSGETWDGEGSQPEWLRVALTREGFLVEELRIERQAEPSSD